MTEYGFIRDVRYVVFGSFLVGDYAVGATSLTVEDAADFSEDGGTLTINEVQYAYSSADLEAEVIYLAAPLDVACVDGDRVDVYPKTVEKQATALQADSDEALTVRVPHALYDRLPEGIREEGQAESVAFELQDGEWVLTDILGSDVVIDSAYIDPSNLPDQTAPDGLSPAISPVPTVTGGIGALFARWTPVENHDLVEYEVHVGTSTGFTTSPSTLERVTSGSSAVITKLPSGAALAYDTDYHVIIVARDVDGPAAPSVSASARMMKVTGPDIASNYVYAGEVQAPQIRGGRVDAELTIGGKIKTAEAGARVELDAAGVRVIDSTNTPTTVLGTSGESTFKGQVEASAMTVTKGLTIRGLDSTGAATVNELSQGGILRLASKTTASVQAPTAVVDWAVTQLKDSLGNNAVTTLGSLFYGVDSKWLVPLTTQSAAYKFNADGTYNSTISYSSATPVKNMAQVGSDYFGFYSTGTKNYLARLTETTTFSDDFTSGTLTTNWPASYGDASLSGGKLKVVTHENTYAGANKTLSAGIKGKAVSAKAELPTFGDTQEAYMQVLNGSSNKAIINSDKNGIQFILITGGVRTQVNATYNAVSMAYWRIAEAAGKVYFQTSADASIWTTQWNTAHGWSDATMSGMSWEMGAGDYAAPNVVAGGGTFEAGTESWAALTSSQVTLSQDSAHAHSGTKSLKAVASGSTYIYAQPTTIDRTKTYVVGMWVYSSSTGLSIGAKAGTTYAATSKTITANTWTYVEETYDPARIAGLTTSSTFAPLVYVTTGQTVWVDDVTLRVVDNTILSNKVTNGTFETDLTGWSTPISGGTIARDTSVKYSGNASLAITRTLPGSYITTGTANGTSGMPVKAGSNNTFTFRYTGNRAGVSISGTVYYYDSAGGVLTGTGYSYVVDSANAWKQFVYMTTAPVNAAYASVAVAATPSGSVVGDIAYFDDIQFGERDSVVANFDTARYTTPALDIEYPSVTPTQVPALGVKGTNLLVAEVDAFGHAVFKEVDIASLAITGSTVTSDVTNVSGPLAGVMYGNFDFGAARYVIAKQGGDGSYTAFNTSGVYQPNESFPLPTGGALGLGYNGSNFVSLGTAGQLLAHTNIKWTTESDLWRTGFTWYDGTSQETAVSPFTNFQMKKRARLKVTSAVLPSGVNAIKVYIGYQSNGAPYAYYQATSTTGTNTVTFTTVGSLNSGTGAPTTSTFASLNPASIQSTNSELVIKADGTIQLGVGAVTQFNADGTGKVKGLIAYSSQDADTTSGNRPALITGDTASTHLRIDGDEIISMTNDTTQGTLFLNDGGTTKTTNLIVTSTQDADITAGNKPALRIGDTTAAHLRIDGDEIIAMTNDNTQGTLFLNYGGETRSTMMVLESITDAGTTAGNKPALRIGSTTGTHLRIDNNEIIAMLGDTGQGTLFLNQGGDVQLGMSGGRVKLAGGDYISGHSRGNSTKTTDANGDITIPHGLPGTPLVANVSPGTAHQLMVQSLTATNIVVRCRSAAGVLLGSGVSVQCFWTAWQ